MKEELHMQREAVHENNPLGTMPVGALLRKFAIPSVIMLVVNNFYNIVDQIFIGQGVGYLGNAATTIAFPVMTIVLALSMLIGAGGSAYASIKLGEGQFDIAEKILGNMITLLVVIGIILCAGGFLAFEPMLRLFGASAATMPYAKDYTGIVLLGVPFMMVGAGLSNMARTDGSPKVAMVSMITGAILNTILDPIYIFVFHWGVRGAAIATITSQILSALILIRYFCHHGNMRIKKKNFKPDWRLIFRFLSVGISSFIIQAANTALMITLNNSLVYYGDMSEVGGDVALSAMGIVLKVSAILIGINIGISAGAQPIIGFNYGAKKPQRIKEAYLMAVGLATAFSIVGWIGCVFFPHVIMKLFGSQEPEFFSFAILSMKTFMFGIFTSGGQIISTAYFQATGQALKASILSLLRQVLLLIPLVVILPTYFGLYGILYAGPVADIGSACIITVFVLLELKKLNGWIKEGV
ncbi:MAG: MATE family efflux transporter [Epulopiscium sp.]|jgi:putative MATE family efflux protein|nr:MATE family efflux transporter [Candidatus Epulonipiscium sp.]